MDISAMETKLQKCLQSKADRDRIIQKKRDKVQQVEDAVHQQESNVEERVLSMEKALHQSRQLAYTTEKKELKKNLRDEAMENGEEFDDNEDNDEPTNEELEAIEIKEPSKNQDYYKNKIERLVNAIEDERQRRRIHNTTQEAALKKYQRAKKSLDDKMANITNIESNAGKLTEDLKERKKRWGQFRGKSQMQKYLVQII